MSRRTAATAMVVSLKTWRHALYAREVLLKLLQDPDWLVRVDVVQHEGDVELRATVTAITAAVRIMLPVAVNGVAVERRPLVQES